MINPFEPETLNSKTSFLPISFLGFEWSSPYRVFLKWVTSDTRFYDMKDPVVNLSTEQLLSRSFHSFPFCSYCLSQYSKRIQMSDPNVLDVTCTLEFSVTTKNYQN